MLISWLILQGVVKVRSNAVTKRAVVDL